jgi:hypothetical protein
MMSMSSTVAAFKGISYAPSMGLFVIELFPLWLEGGGLRGGAVALDDGSGITPSIGYFDGATGLAFRGCKSVPGECALN